VIENVMMQTPETELAMQRHASSLDVIMSTIPVPYDFDLYVARLTRDGILRTARRP
jgi:D-arabinose 1-dehydrogenase-like Zn-dependent alcohol dehydrogenase